MLQNNDDVNAQLKPEPVEDSKGPEDGLSGNADGGSGGDQEMEIEVAHPQVDEEKKEKGNKEEDHVSDASDSLSAHSSQQVQEAMRSD